MASSYRKAFEGPVPKRGTPPPSPSMPGETGRLDTRITGAREEGPNAPKEFVGGEGARETGSSIADEYVGQERGGFSIERTPGVEDIWGNRAVDDLSIKGSPRLSALDHRAVEGNLSNADLAQGSSMAARMYRNPYDVLTQRGGRYNPVQMRGVGQRGIVGEAMQAQREGREVDPIMGRTSGYIGDPNAPVDHRPVARNPTEAAFWENWEQVNQSWLRGDYQKVGAGSGSLAEQGKLAALEQGMPPRLQRRGQSSTGTAQKGAKYDTTYADHDEAKDVLWEEAYMATDGGGYEAMADWLIQEKGMPVDTAIHVSYLRELEQLEFALQTLNGGPTEHLDQGWIREGEKRVRMYKGWPNKDPADVDAMRKIMERQRTVWRKWQATLNKYNAPGNDWKTKALTDDTPAEDRWDGSWSDGLEAYV